MVDRACRNGFVNIDLAAVLVGCGDFFGCTFAAPGGTDLGRERKRGRGYGAGHQGDLQALSHNRVFLSTFTKTDFALASCYPEPDGESFNQSKTIIGAGHRWSNLSEGCRTTGVI